MLLRVVFAVFLLFAAAFAETSALAQDNPSGLPLPRFATTRSSPINVRVGPGTRYDVAWVYVKPGTPVEIIQEFDTWRKIRDFDGSEGWVHQNLLSGNRAGLVAPWRAGEQLPLFSGKSEEGGVRAYLPAGFQVGITECDKAWCTVTAMDHPEGGGQRSYDGFLPQDELWGVYQDEEFD
jgi:SH3-like domain-containing protein